MGFAFADENPGSLYFRPPRARYLLESSGLLPQRRDPGERSIDHGQVPGFLTTLDSRRPRTRIRIVSGAHVVRFSVTSFVFAHFVYVVDQIWKFTVRVFFFSFWYSALNFRTEAIGVGIENTLAMMRWRSRCVLPRISSIFEMANLSIAIFQFLEEREFPFYRRRSSSICAGSFALDFYFENKVHQSCTLETRVVRASKLERLYLAISVIELFNSFSR